MVTCRSATPQHQQTGNSNHVYKVQFVQLLFLLNAGLLKMMRVSTIASRGWVEGPFAGLKARSVIAHVSMGLADFWREADWPVGFISKPGHS